MRHPSIVMWRPIVALAFGAPAPQAPAPPPPPPQDDSGAQAERAARQAEERARTAGGRASTILTSPLGDTSDTPSARKVLLGG